MTDAQQKAAASHFASYWENRGYEKGESQPFWLSLLRDVYGVEYPEEFISFEDQVHLDNTSFSEGSEKATSSGRKQGKPAHGSASFGRF